MNRDEIGEEGISSYPLPFTVDMQIMVSQDPNVKHKYMVLEFETPQGSSKFWFEMPLFEAFLDDAKKMTVLAQTGLVIPGGKRLTGV